MHYILSMVLRSCLLSCFILSDHTHINHYALLVHASDFVQSVHDLIHIDQRRPSKYHVFMIKELQILLLESYNRGPYDP